MISSMQEVWALKTLDATQCLALNHLWELLQMDQCLKMMVLCLVMILMQIIGPWKLHLLEAVPLNSQPK